ncbi:MAG: hypothetical protein AAF993_22545 [Pseudomonadota bacterium]
MNQKIFIPFSEALLQQGQQPPGELVPYQLAYQCVRLLDGTYDFSDLTPASAARDMVKIELRPAENLQSRRDMGHAA